MASKKVKDKESFAKNLPPEESQVIPNRFGGWLIVIGAGLIIFPTILALVYIPTYIKVFTDPFWKIITSKTSESYNPYLEPLILTEMIYMALLVILDLFSLVLFWMKKRLFPKIFVIVIALFTVYPVINTVLSRIFPVPNVGFQWKKFLISVVIGIVLILYIWASPRIKNTFVYRLGSKEISTKKV